LIEADEPRLFLYVILMNQGSGLVTFILPRDLEGLYDAKILKNLNPLEVVIVTEKQLMQQTERVCCFAP